MRTGRTAVRLSPLLPALVALFCPPPGFSWDTHAVDGFNPTTTQAPWAAFQRGDTADFPESAPEPGVLQGELQQRWYAPVEGPKGPAYLERLPMGTFRPLKVEPPPVERGYKGYSFRPLGSPSGPRRAPAGAARLGTRSPSPGVRTEPNRYLPGAEWYSDYGRGSSRFNFRPDRQPVRRRSEGYDSYDPRQPVVGADYEGEMQDIPSTDYYLPRTFDGPQADRW